MQVPTRYSLRATSEKGFTLIEILVFVGIFTIVIVGFLGAFISASSISVRQNSSTEVATQSQFLLQSIQYAVERSSAIDITADVSTTVLKLRMASSSEDPTIIQLTGNAVTITKGSDPTSTLTSSKVNVSALQFTRRVNAPGHDSVAVAFTMQYNSTNIKQKASDVLSTSITRVAAATFDSNIIPSSGSTFGLGASAGDWKAINNTIFFSGNNVGIGGSGYFAAAARLQVSGGDIYVDTAGQGLIMKAPNGTSCYRFSVTNTGAATTTSVSC